MQTKQQLETKVIHIMDDVEESVICLGEEVQRQCDIISLSSGDEDEVKQQVPPKIINITVKSRKLRKIKQKRLRPARQQHYQETLRIRRLNNQPKAALNLQGLSSSSRIESSGNGNIPMIILDSAGAMTKQKADIIQAKILLEVNKASDAGETIQFLSSKYNPSSFMLTFDCANVQSQKWLCDTVDSVINLREGWQLRAQYNEFQKVSIFIWWEAENHFIILKRLQVQNPELEVCKWIFLHSTVTENTINLFLGIPTDILPKIAALDYKIFYGINTVELHLRQTQES